jgi:hypothetical protein
MQVLLYIIYGDRTIIGFVDFVANLLNKPTDGATVSVRKRISFRPLVSTIPDTESWPQLTNMCELAFIEYNPTFDSIMPFPWFFDVTRKTSK